MQKKWMDIWNEAIANDELEAHLPKWLQDDIIQFCKGMDENDRLYLDCYWEEALGSINSAQYACISKSDADYLRGKYIFKK